MTSEIVKGDLEKLLGILSSNRFAFEIENEKIIIVHSSIALLQNLSDINVFEADGMLDFSKFIINRIFLKHNYEQRIDPSVIEEDFVVLDITGAAVLYFEKVFCVYNSGTLLTEVENTVAYYELYNFLKSAEFADHHNSADEEIIIYSSGKGILKIKYQNIAPLFNAPIRDKAGKLLDALKDQQFRTYFKNSLFDVANGNYIELSTIIVTYNIILSAAKRDLEIALRQFDFEKFRDALYNQKDKFFVNIRDVLSKIYGQIVGIPISIAAAVYTTYKTENQPIVPILILISFITYVVIYIVIQWNYYKDIKEIQTDFLRDFYVIRTQSGLPQDDINQEYNKVDRKIYSTIRIAITLMVAVTVLGLAVTVFIATQI